MDITKLKEILEKHMHWLEEDCDGWESMKANLSGANLYKADLHGANLREADLSGADLSGAKLIGADLYKADLSGADLREADLIGANLYKADLREADLSGAKVEDKILTKFFPICCPENGAFVGWKNANGHIVKLQISEDAKRSSAFGRKCRCSKAVVMSIENLDGSDSGLKEIASYFDNNFIYRVGETVEVENFDDDRKNECAPGIHFFITRQEAVDY